MSFLKNRKIKIILVVIILVVIGFFVYHKYTNSDLEYDRNSPLKDNSILNENIKNEDLEKVEIVPNEPVVMSHIETPDEVKAIYMSSWVASGTKYRDPLI